MWNQVNMKCFRDLLFLCWLVHFGLKEINEFGLLGDGPLHLYLLVGVHGLQERKHIFREGNPSEYNSKRTPFENTYFLLASPEIPCSLPTSFILISHLTRTFSKWRRVYFIKLRRYFTEHLYILQLVLQVSPLSLEHVGLVQSVLQALGQTEYVALLEVHLLLQLPLLLGHQH